MAQTVATGICAACKIVSRGMLIRLDDRKLNKWGVGAMLMPVRVSVILSSGFLHHILDVHGAQDGLSLCGIWCSVITSVCRLQHSLADDRIQMVQTLDNGHNDR